MQEDVDGWFHCTSSHSLVLCPVGVGDHRIACTFIPDYSAIVEALK